MRTLGEAPSPVVREEKGFAGHGAGCAGWGEGGACPALAIFALITLTVELWATRTLPNKQCHLLLHFVLVRCICFGLGQAHGPHAQLSSLASSGGFLPGLPQAFFVTRPLMAS